MNKIQIIEGLQEFMTQQLDTMATTNPIMCIVKPIASRVLHNKIGSLTSYLDLLADSSGNIDIVGIINEMIDSLVNTQPFKINVPALGDINIGGGKVELGIPFTDKNIVFNSKDFKDLKEILTSKQQAYE